MRNLPLSVDLPMAPKDVIDRYGTLIARFSGEDGPANAAAYVDRENGACEAPGDMYHHMHVALEENKKLRELVEAAREAERYTRSYHHEGADRWAVADRLAAALKALEGK